MSAIDDKLRCWREVHDKLNEAERALRKAREDLHPARETIGVLEAKVRSLSSRSDEAMYAFDAALASHQKAHWAKDSSLHEADQSTK